MTDLIIAIIGSNAIFSFLTVVVTKLLDGKSLTRKTLSAVSYAILSDKIEQRLDSGYATPEQRREIEILHEAYKANGWNGDMDVRIAKVYALPTKDLSKDWETVLP